MPDENPQPQPEPPAADASPPTRNEKGQFVPGAIQPGAHIFQPGHSGNPHGSSAKQRMTMALLRIMDKKDGIDEALAQVILSKALKGDIRFVELLYERIEGRVSQKSEVNVTGVTALLTPEEAAAAIEDAYKKRHEKPNAGEGSQTP